ncbi:Protein ASP-5 [Aphelenchoides avenae]|nr:Protein ASP-5 [Aphelenchus avenae]
MKIRGKWSKSGGIGPSAANPSGIESPLIAAHRLGLIEQPVVGVWQSNVTTCDEFLAETAGELTYGGLDEKRCGPVAAYHPISSSAGPYGPGWFLQPTITVGNVTVSPPQVQFDFTVDGLFADESFQTELLKSIGVTREYYFDCALAATFNFTLSVDGHDYVVPGAAIVTRDDVNDNCSFSIQTPEGDATDGHFVVGAFFLKQFCHAFDVGNNRLGFGRNLYASAKIFDPVEC